MKDGAAGPCDPKYVTFHANHPFLYVISEKETGTIFFIGQYTGN
jgi:serpin B